MINLAGPPAIGGVTMLGLNLVRTFDSFSCFGIKPTTKKAAPAKPSSPLTTSSLSTPSSAPSKLLLWERLDACIQKDGAMDPFHTSFGHSLFDVGLVNSQAEDKSTSNESSQIPAVSRGIASHLSLHQNGGILTKVPSCTTAPPRMRDTLEVTPFSALFPEHLLLDPVEPITHAKTNNLPVLATTPPCHQSIHPDQLLHEQVTSDGLTSIDADLVGRPTECISGQDDSGRTSPQSYTGIGEDFGSLFGTLSSSRRSSWATSINTSRADVDDDSCSFSSDRVAADPFENEDIFELLHDYEHYSDLIDIGHPDNVRKTDIIVPLPGAEEGMDAATAEEDTQVSGKPTIETHEDRVTACPEAPAMDAATDQPEEPDMEVATGETNARMLEADEPAAEASGYTVLECPDALTEEAGSEQLDEPAQAEISSSAQLEPPHTPAEEVAWAHAHCDTSPENQRLRILSDERGREYVLYHNCFHVLPIEMAREFMQRENDDDDLDEPEPYDGDELSDGDGENDDRAGGPAGEQEEQVGAGIEYAAPSDICMGTCLLYKVDEGRYYENAWDDYFGGTFAPPARKQAPEMFKSSRLRYVESAEEMEGEEDEEV